MKRPRGKLKIELDYVSLPQAIAFKKMLEFMNYLGKIGASRWVGYYSDGDGDFQPKILQFDYEPCELPESKIEVKKRDKSVFYGIDFDSIAWEVFHNSSTSTIKKEDEND